MGSWGKGQHFTEAAQEIPPQELNSMLRPERISPAESWEKDVLRGNSMCQGPEVGTRTTCRGVSEGMIVSL